MDVNELITPYIGLPYKHHGRSREGFDCYGLIVAIYADLGFKLMDIEEKYDEHWSWQGRNHFIENYHKQWDIVTTPKPLDVIMFKNKRGIVNHGGIIIDRFRFINARKAGVVIDRINGDKWAKSLDGFYHLKEATW